MPTQDELQQYIHKYQSEALEGVNRHTEGFFDRANVEDAKLGSQLILLSSALIAVIGTFAEGRIINNYLKAVIIGATLSLLISICAGLRNNYDMLKFWEAAGKYKHAEGEIIVNDKSKTYNDLQNFRKKLQAYRDKAPMKSGDKARNLQVGAFIVGIALLTISVTLLILA